MSEEKQKLTEWFNLSQVKDARIQFLYAYTPNEEEFINSSRGIYRKRSSSVRIERKVPYELESRINQAIDEIINEHLEEVQTTLIDGALDGY